MQLRIVGTSHIATQSVQEITKAIEQEKPQIIALELDVQRAASLWNKEKRSTNLQAIFSVGIKGYLFAKIGQIVQQKLGKITGISPGSEMKTAMEIAHKQKLEVAFIDQPIQITLRNFSQSIGWKEKGRFIADIVKGLISPKKQLKEMGLGTFDLHKVPEKALITAMMSQLKKRYPSVYKTLVEDRNKYMVKKLVGLVKTNPEKKILVIVGVGHKEGMEELLGKIDVVK
ncbi:MAG: TraB family protein [archaeon GW2011_AR9]|nr:MAG: TraB family protein [archaeon GW2011_AR9]MBS3120246.1 TraB/GumN family protein [Candidatus Woesearchaeota archaeon]HIG92943.1 hypothetical protein [Candidatus Woesearchaeota archaeon]HIH12676.1 hypothetical protein [Candidatus Woesearchaeota archaeon]